MNDNLNSDPIENFSSIKVDSMVNSVALQRRKEEDNPLARSISSRFFKDILVRCQCVPLSSAVLILSQRILFYIVDSKNVKILKKKI